MQQIFTANFIINKLDLLIREHIKKYQSSLHECDKCHIKTSHHFIKQDNKLHCVQPDCKGKLFRIYETNSLYTQLLYYRDLFDVKRALYLSFINENALEKAFDEHLKTFDEVTDHVKNKLKNSRYNSIDLGLYFSFMLK